jgi:hypothetical protein
MGPESFFTNTPFTTHGTLELGMLGLDMKLESRPCFEVVKASLMVTLVNRSIAMELYVVLG